MIVAMTEFSRAIEEQRMASSEREKYLELEMAEMMAQGRDTLKNMDKVWQARIDDLNEDYAFLAENALTDEKMLSAMQKAFAEERKIYLESRAEESARFQDQFKFLQRMLSSHIETTLATVSNLHEAVKDIRLQLRNMNEQLTIHLKNQSKLIE